MNVKANEQQEIQALHRIRERLARDRTGLFKQTRGLLAEKVSFSLLAKNNFHSVLRKHSMNRDDANKTKTAKCHEVDWD